METFQRESMVRGYHIYGEQWVAAVGEELECRRERGNPRDTYAVAVVRDDITVGHLPRKISRISALFIRRNNSLPSNGQKEVLF